MEPEIFQTGSPWGNLCLISMAIFAAAWALAITAAVTAAAVIPYLAVRMTAVRTMTARTTAGRTTAGRTTAGPGRSRAAGRTNRKLLLAAAAVIILMAAAVTGLAYGVGAAKHHHHPSFSKNVADRLGAHLEEMLDDGPSGLPLEGGWVTHEDVNPVTDEIDDKHFWLVLHDGLVFGSGWRHDESGG